MVDSSSAILLYTSTNAWNQIFMYLGSFCVGIPRGKAVQIHKKKKQKCTPKILFQKLDANYFQAKLQSTELSVLLFSKGGGR